MDCQENISVNSLVLVPNLYGNVASAVLMVELWFSI